MPEAITFKANDIITPRHQPLTTASQLCVIEILKDGCLVCAPKGGGPQRRYTPAVQHALRFVHVGDAQVPTAKTTFELECYEGLEFEGYDNGERWNGWAVPILTKKGMTALIEATSDDDHPESTQLSWVSAGAAPMVQATFPTCYEAEPALLDTIHVDGELCYRCNLGWTFDSNVDRPRDPFADLISAARMASFPEDADGYRVEDALEKLREAIRYFDHVEV